MALPEIIILLVVLAVGIPSSWRNPTAGALVLAWVAGRVAYIVTGDSLPVEFYLYPDIFVLGVIMAKREAYSCPPDGNTEQHLRSVLLCRTRQDRIIMLIFPLMWLLYYVDIHPFYKWYALWALAIAQFLAAGWEAVVINRRARAARTARLPPFAEYRMMAWRGRPMTVHEI